MSNTNYIIGNIGKHLDKELFILLFCGRNCNCWKVNISWILCIYCQWAKSQCVQMAMVLKEILKLIILGHFRTNPNEVDQKSYQLLVFGYKTIAPCLFVTTPCIFLFATKTHFRRAAKVQTYSFIWFNQKSKLSDWFSEIIHKGENTSCVQLEKKETRKRKTRLERLSVS